MAIVPLVADVAHFNPVNFSELKAAGFVGVIHKARQGIAVGDPKYVARMAAARDAGLRWGAYDFATHDDVAANVAAFLDYARLDDADSAWLDFEDNAHSQMTDEQAYEFLDRVAQKRGRPAAFMAATASARRSSRTIRSGSTWQRSHRCGNAATSDRSRRTMPSCSGACRRSRRGPTTF